jgi:hypothetical protein
MVSTYCTQNTSGSPQAHISGFEAALIQAKNNWAPPPPPPLFLLTASLPLLMTVTYLNISAYSFLMSRKGQYRNLRK